MFCRRRHGNRVGVVGDSRWPGVEDDGGGSAGDDAHKIEISLRVKKGRDREGRWTDMLGWTSNATPD